jgi:acetyl-CoA carboxylase biotin carboxyl carrier protein
MELANILELIHAVSDSDLTEFNLQDDTLNISMSKEKTIVQQMAVNTDPADAQQYQPVVQQAVHVESVNAVNDEVQTGSGKVSSCRYLLCSIFSGKSPLCKSRR